MKKTPEEDLASYIKRRRQVFKEHITPEIVRMIALHFGCHLPAFQGRAGSYDTLDAMRRDAYREVVIWLSQEAGIETAPSIHDFQQHDNDEQMD